MSIENKARETDTPSTSTSSLPAKFKSNSNSGLVRSMTSTAAAPMGATCIIEISAGASAASLTCSPATASARSASNSAPLSSTTSTSIAGNAIGATRVIGASGATGFTSSGATSLEAPPLTRDAQFAIRSSSIDTSSCTWFRVRNSSTHEVKYSAAAPINLISGSLTGRSVSSALLRTLSTRQATSAKSVCPTMRPLPLSV